MGQYAAAMRTVFQNATLAYGSDHGLVERLGRLVAEVSPMPGGGGGGDGGGGGGGRGDGGGGEIVEQVHAIGDNSDDHDDDNTDLDAQTLVDAASVPGKEATIDWDALEQEQQAEIAAAIASMQDDAE